MAFRLILILALIVIIIVITILIGIYVYRDAARRGMNAALWTLTAVLAPILTGFIIYLLVRNSYSDLKCLNCGSHVMEQFAVCPICGVRLKTACSNCGFPLEAGWTVCPKCASSLPAYNDGYMSPIRKKDTALGKILVLVILIPVVLLVLLSVVSFTAFNSLTAVRVESSHLIGDGGFYDITLEPYDIAWETAAEPAFEEAWVETSQLTKKDYEEQSKTISWINKCDEDPSKTYALCYRAEYGGQEATYYLIYRPIQSRNDDLSVSIDSRFFEPVVSANFFHSPDAAPDEKLFCIAYYSYEYVELRVFVEGIEIDCPITEVDYNPTNLS